MPGWVNVANALTLLRLLLVPWIVEAIARVKLHREYDPTAPRGVAGRNSDNTLIQSILHWEPRTPLREGMARTYTWIAEQYADRKAGKRTVS